MFILALTTKNGNDAVLPDIGTSRQFASVLSDFETMLKSDAVQSLEKTCTTYQTKMTEFASKCIIYK